MVTKMVVKDNIAVRGAGQVVKLGFFKANFTLNFPIGWSWSLRFDPS